MLVYFASGATNLANQQQPPPDFWLRGAKDEPRTLGRVSGSRWARWKLLDFSFIILLDLKSLIERVFAESPAIIFYLNAAFFGGYTMNTNVVKRILFGKSKGSLYEAPMHDT